MTTFFKFTVKAFLSLFLAAILMVGSMKLAAAHVYAHSQEAQDAKEQNKSAKKKSFIKWRIFKPGDELPDDMKKLIEEEKEEDRLEKLYQEAMPLLENWIPSPERDRGMAMLKEASDGGHTKAMVEYGSYLIAFPKQLRSDQVLGVELIQRAARKGEPDAFYSLAAMQLGRKQYVEAENTLLRGLDVGISFENIDQKYKIQYLLCYQLIHGYLGDKRIFEGRKMLENLVAKKFPEAIYLLGMGHKKGQFTLEKNQTKYLQYIKKAASFGNVQARAELAQYLFRVNPTPNSIYKSINLIQKLIGKGEGKYARLYAFIITGAPLRCLVALEEAYHWQTAVEKNSTYGLLYKKDVLKMKNQIAELLIGMKISPNFLKGQALAKWKRDEKLMPPPLTDPLTLVRKCYPDFTPS